MQYFMPKAAPRRYSHVPLLDVGFVLTYPAVVSFVHIEHLAAINGQTALAAYLLPLSIDGTVAVVASRAFTRRPRLEG
jgi:hypothetical protein